MYATEEIQDCRECTTNDTLSFTLQDMFLGLSSTKKQVFLENLIFLLS